MSTTSKRIPRSLPEIARAFFSFPSPRLLGVQLAIGLAARPFLGPLRAGDAIALAGVIAYWPLQEWFLHKHVLHFEPVRVGRFVIDLPAARAHGRHHETPHDLGQALLPGWTIAALIPVHLLFWKLVAPTRAVACTGIICLGAAALSYEWIHFMTHTGYRPKTRWFREVKRRHLAHHYRDAHRWFAFVVPAIDDWLGTGEPRDEPRDGVTGDVAPTKRRAGR